MQRLFFTNLFALTLTAAGCGSSTSTPPDTTDGTAPTGASCDAVCAHATELCGRSAPDCAAQCARDLSSAQRDCIAAAASCTAASTCVPSGTGTGGNTGATGGGTSSGDDDGSIPSTVEELVQAWTTFVRDTRARAKDESKTVTLWTLRVRADGAEVFTREKMSDPEDVKKELAALTLRADAKVSAELEAYAYDAVSKTDYLWVRRSYQPGPL